MMTHRYNSKHNGFTLLEVMIAMVIFSIGLLGLAGMQSAGIRNNQVSYARTIATQLAYDMADRIRNNPGVNYAATAPNGGTNCLLTACNAATMAAFDLDEWLTAIGNPTGPLKSGQGFVIKNPNTFTVIIGWNDRGTAAVPTQADCQADPIPDDFSCVRIEVSTLI